MSASFSLCRQITVSIRSRPRIRWKEETYWPIEKYDVIIFDNDKIHKKYICIAKIGLLYLVDIQVIY